MLEWLGREFDAEAFDIKKIDLVLPMKRGSSGWYLP